MCAHSPVISFSKVNFYGNKELKLQFYLQAKLMSYIPTPQADHYDMQIYQGLGRIYMQRN